MEEQGIRYRKRKMLDMPSWTPGHRRKGTETERRRRTGDEGARRSTVRQPLPPAGAAPDARRATETGRPRGMAAPPTSPARPSSRSRRAAPAPAAPYRYVLLAAFAEPGTPPPGLQSNSGLIAVELPEDSSLTTLFQAGAEYRFTSDKFEGYYRVLEAYPDRRRRPCWSIRRACRSTPPRATTCTGGSSTTQLPLTQRRGLR